MSTELATAYVSLVSSTAGLGKDVVKEYGDAGDEASKSFGSKFSGGLKALIGPVATIAATVGLKQWLSAAAQASDATDKFKQTLSFAGLNTSKIDALTKSAQAYADQTVYSLADIQGTTAQLAANGVKDYDQLAEAAGNLNAVAGGNADTYRSVSLVLTQTAGAGKLTSQNWLQLANAIPGASGQLQKALKDAGAFTGDFATAMSKGQISADEFNAAILKIGMTDVAKQAATSTKTIEGAWGNLSAALTGGLADILTQLKPTITGLLNGLATGVGPALGALSAGISGLSQHTTLIKVLGITIGSVVASWVAYKAVTASISFVQSAIAIGKMVAQMIMQGSWLVVLTARWIAYTAASTASRISGVAQALAGVVAWLAIQGAQLVASAAQWIASTAAMIASKTAMLAVNLATKAWAAGQWLLNAALDANPIGLVVIAIAALVAGIVIAWKNSETFRTVVLAVWGAIKTAVLAVVDWFTGNVVPFFSKTLPAAIGVVVSWVKAHWPLLLSILTGPIGAAVIFIVTHWQQIKDTTVSIFNAVSSWISSKVNAIVGFFRGGWDLAKSLTSSAFESIVSGIRSKITSAVDTVKGIKDKILGVLTGIGTAIYNAGASLIQKLIDGILSKIWAVASAAGNIADKVKGFFGGSPVEEGPLLGWNNGRVGKNLVQMGLIDGLDGSTAGVAAASARMAGAISAPSVAASQSASGVPSWLAGLPISGTLELANGVAYIRGVIDGDLDHAAGSAGLVGV